MDLPLIIAAPMAGGPSTPTLVSAVSFGFLAWGTSSLDQARSEIEQVEGSFGINLFYPQDFRPDLGDIEQVAADLGAEVPEVDLSNGYQQKLRLALDAGPAVISSTFGCFTASEVELIHGRGCEAWVTVTNEADARTAIMRGVDCLVVQGPRAGGHRGTWSPELEPDTRSLEVLLEAIVPFGVPVVAAGGARDASDVERLLASGAAAVACGTAFLLADEAGTSPANRVLLDGGGRSVLSRAFSGRWARGVETEFTRTHPDMPPIYPYLKPMVPDNPYCLVGEDFEGICNAPAREIETALTP